MQSAEDALVERNFKLFSKQFQPTASPAPTATFKSLTNQFMKIYGLTKGGSKEPFRQIHHDGVHAMTGFGITLADEVRIAVCEMLLLDKNNDAPLQVAYNRAEELYNGMVWHLKNKRWEANTDETELATAEYRNIQAQSHPLSSEEIHAQYGLGKRMNEAIYRLTGKFYIHLMPEELAALDFSGLDFSVEAHSLKSRFEKPENKELEIYTSAAFFVAACRQGRGADIPAPCSPWHGARLKRYADLVPV